MTDEAVAAEVWQQQSVWSQTADRLKTSIGRHRVAGLALTVGGATAGALAGLAHLPTAAASALAVAAAAAMGTVPLLRPKWSGAVLRDWTRARSVSEALKSETYLYLAHAGDYAGADRERRLADATDALQTAADDLQRYQGGITAKPRELPPVGDLAGYVEKRLTPQIDGYYRPKAAQLQTVLSRFRAVEFGGAVVGGVLGAVAARYAHAGIGAWIAVTATVTAALAAHVAAARYDYQLVEYLRTAGELARLRRAAARASSPSELEALVLRCEHVISIQNEGWMAKLAARSTTEQGG